ncbi:hypothetical protein CW751_00570 [Brumimicrobium salinarum]|uniref:Uncharacterized protein n=1 Tax=Brumimicrobium salinarum TaxID=2058658 RepID=A0A2I0R5M3_9FLAO|nr:hypothetical protein [Brumimicrobium salinarum]PKR81865.1 hypothetical protein CW751_00570 [Brumimicrobium salinarum]
MLLLIILISCRKEKNRICEIYESQHGYAIGKVESSVNVPTRVTYNYNIDGVGYSAKLRAYGIGQEDSKMIGRSYLVVFEDNNPDNSHLNTYYRILEESDFMDLVNQFEEEPPVPNWPKKCKN